MSHVVVTENSFTADSRSVCTRIHDGPCQRNPAARFLHCGRTKMLASGVTDLLKQGGNLQLDGDDANEAFSVRKAVCDSSNARASGSTNWVL